MLRILVVDDDCMLAILLGEMLQDMGHEVCPLETTQAGAVAAAALHRPELIIIDVGLGEGSGLSAMDDVLRAGFVPHIFMSGNVVRVQAMRPGTPVLGKPFNQVQLEQAIQRALDNLASRACPASFAAVSSSGQGPAEMTQALWTMNGKSVGK